MFGRFRRFFLQMALNWTVPIPPPCFENLVVMSTFEMARVNFEPALFVGCGAWHSLVVGTSLSTCRTMISPWVSHLVLITTTGYFRGGLFVQLLRVGDTT